MTTENTTEETVAQEGVTTEAVEQEAAPEVATQECSQQEAVSQDAPNSGETVEHHADATPTTETKEVPAPQVGEDGIARLVLSESQKVGLLEALLLASGDPLSLGKIEEILTCSKSEVLALAEKLKAAYATDERGLELALVSQKLQLRTKPVFADYVRQLISVKPRKLSQAALETLAVVAYQQPVVKSEIDKIRGVDVAPTIKTLLERKLIKILGYQASVGQPALYGTTEDFLSIFGLNTLSELPSLRDLKALVKEPGEALETSNDEDASDDSAEDSVEATSDAESASTTEAQASVQ